MTVDLTGGNDPSRDHFSSDKPEDPEFRESASMWVFDDAGDIGLPRVGIEALSETWDQRDLQVNLGFPDGRAVIVRGSGPGRSPVDEDGICRTFAAGGLEFAHVEPFETVTMSYDGEAFDSTSAAMARGELGRAPKVSLRIEVEMTCAAPPWIPGTLNADAAEAFHEGFAGAFISPRYEQLCTSQGTVEVGDDAWSFTGTGLRIHRQGRRDVGGFWGHFWPSALFPSGNGFGGLAFPEREGEPTYNEAYVFSDGRMIPATLVECRWLSRLQPSGEDVSVTLRTADGDVHIEGETVFATCMPGGSHRFAPALQPHVLPRRDVSAG